MSRLSQLLEEAVHRPAFSPASMESLRRRNATRHRRARRLFAAALVACVAALTLGFVLPTTDSNTDFGFRVSAANASSLPESFSHEITPIPLNSVSLGLLPYGFELVSSSTVNSASNVPYFEEKYNQTETYARTTPEGTESLIVDVVQSSSLFQPGAPLPFQVPLSPTKRGTTVALTNVGDDRGVIAVTPFAGATRESCMSQSGAGYATIAAPTNTLAWLVQPGVMLEVSSEGLDVALLRDIATNLRYDSALYSCLSATAVVNSSGDCAPGTQASPDTPALRLAASTTPSYALGTVGSKGWLLEVQRTGFGVSWQLVFNDQLASQNLGCPGDVASTVDTSAGGAEIRVSSDQRGDRFAVGYLPNWVSSVSATSRGGASVSEPVLSRSLAGERFFVLYLGSRDSDCGQLCTGPVTLGFSGSSHVPATVAFAFARSQTGVVSMGLELVTDQLTGTEAAG